MTLSNISITQGDGVVVAWLYLVSFSKMNCSLRDGGNVPNDIDHCIYGKWCSDCLLSPTFLEKF